MRSFTVSACVFALALFGANAAPVNEVPAEKRAYSARLTWYDTSGAPGACGSQNSNSDYIVAMNTQQYDGSCGKNVAITVGDKTINAKVADMCPGCPYGGLDLTPGAFQGLGSLDTGVLQGSWYFTD